MTAGVIDRLAELANDNAWLVHRGRFLDVTFLIEVGTAPYLVRIHRITGHADILVPEEGWIPAERRWDLGPDGSPGSGRT